MDTSFRTLMVPLDGSSLAESALPYAVRFATALGSEVVLLRAALAQTGSGSSPNSAQVHVVSEAEEYLVGLESHLKTLRVPCRSVVPYGPAAESIVDNAELQRADLVVMSAHGRSGTGRWAHGGVADKVVSGLGTPVFLIQGADDEDAEFCRRAILVPLDGSELAESILPSIAHLAGRLGVGVVLLAVVHSSPPDAQAAALSSGRIEALEYVRRAAGWLAARGVPARAEVRHGQPAEEILDRGCADDVWFVALSSHGRSGIGRWVYGSIAEKVLYQAQRPVFLRRAPGARPRAGEPVRARRCHNCGREVYLQNLAESDVCPRCGFSLRACANCQHYDGVVCSMDNPWNRGIYDGTPCDDFAFRSTVGAGPVTQDR